MTRWTPSDMPDQTGRTVLVTGASSGLGLQTAIALSRAGARVLMACRNPARAADALAVVQRAVPGAQAELVAVDLASLASVEAGAADVAGRTGSLDVLVNNAGVMAVPEGRTVDGFETQLGTNHLGHFALTGRLLPLLLAAPAARVVTVSSGMHRLGRMDFEDLMGRRGYSRWRAYGQSKLANLLFTAELDRRAQGRLRAVAAHPGYAATHLQQGQQQPLLEGFMRVANAVVAQSDRQGAWPQLYAATAPDVHGDEYFGPHLLELRGHPVRAGRSRQARSAADTRRLWEVSEELTGVTYDL